MKKSLTDSVRSFIEEENLFPAKSPLLVACSGGMDSSVALNILHGLNYPVGIAHCNFKLREEASDGDQKFCKELASKYDVAFHTIDFDTEKYAGDHKLSIQEAARDLRYEWLEKIRKKDGYHFVVTAHHKNDNAETVLMNLVKRSGLRGLHGIVPKRDKIVRPLLCLSRNEIETYASEHFLEFRTDASNKSDKYTRNFIRNKILPGLEEINPEAVEAIHSLAGRVRDAEMLMDERLIRIRRQIVLEHGDTYEIKFGYILTHRAGRTILYELIRDFGFNSDQSSSIFEGLSAQSGIEFLSGTHRLIKDRRSIFVTPHQSDKVHIRKYDSIPKQIIFNNYKIQVREVPVEKCTIKRSPNYAYLDRDKIELPLTIRYWKDGDYFYPYGMTRARSDKPGKKKLSKYFKDEKIPLHQKDTTPVLFSGDKLIWLVGHRIDDRLKVGKDTKTVLKFKILDS